MALIAYDFKRKTKHMFGDTELGYTAIDSAKETKKCQALVRKGLLGPELALSFQPFWRRYLYSFFMEVVLPKLFTTIPGLVFVIERDFVLSSNYNGHFMGSITSDIM
ncbi:uncharacterized protein N7483_005481 [Penicillium malachiteum]|uniref:uncharacterized protein n=1 Tax=Penicillium malachiteum TaxID=1324776 RepID=UPI0025467ABE|nr:uncharacterized protein N7483_005481 [Penicillium malachiteum]KAJ5730973.1 hypothetical protein N7483_005481 [Penicillium malachiteum]